LAASVGGKRTSSLNWFAGPEAAIQDAEKGWRHVLARHQQDALRQELNIAKLELGRNATAENLTRLKHAKSALEQAEGEEAEVEDFGLASGRDVTI
jgi:DNA primase